MTNICMIVHQYYYRDPRVRRYAEFLSEAGFNVDIICPRGLNTPEYRSHTNIRVFTIPLKRNYKGKENYLYEYLLGFLLYFFKLSKLYLKNRYKIIHIHNIPDFLVFTAIIPKLFNSKIILDIHDLMPELTRSKFDSKDENFLLRLIKLQEKLSVKFSDAVITANNNFKKKLIERNIESKEITVINNIADIKVFNREKYYHLKSERDKNFTLIYPGTLAPRYGLNVAIEALPALKNKIPGIKLKIIGPDIDYTRQLIELAEKLDVISNIDFISLLPIEEIPAHIIRADIGIYTALSDPHMEIATPTKVIEYAIMGVPIVASRLKVLSDMFDESSVMFFEPGNITEFVNCIIELYNNPLRRTELVKNNDSNFLKRYTWEEEKNKYFSLVNKLCDQD